MFEFGAMVRNQFPNMSITLIVMFWDAKNDVCLRGLVNQFFKHLKPKLHIFTIGR